MPEITNHQRAAWARNALAVFTAEVFLSDSAHPDAMHPEDLKDAIADLMCDLMHLATQRGMDAAAVTAQARLNYEAEIAERA